MTDHLVIMIEPYLTEILERAKYIEARFSKNKCAPYEQVKTGDKLLLKKSGGEIMGEALAGLVEFYEDLNPRKVKEIFKKYEEGLRAREDFVKAKLDSKFATLVWVDYVVRVTPRSFEHNDRRGWVVLPKVSNVPSLLSRFGGK